MLAVLLCASCRTYNDRISAPLGAFERGDFASAEAIFADMSGPGFLTGAEAGMAAFARADFDAALGHFQRALAASESIEEQAVLGLTSLRESVLSLAVNESQSDYAGEGYERVMLHVMLAMCYLAQGQVDSVLVESRRVDELLVGQEELYETEYRAGGIGHLLSAVAYELSGKPGEAYIDYQRLEEKRLGGELVASAIRRLGVQLGRLDPDELGENGAPVPAGWPSVVVIAGLGMGPAKREIKIDVPLPDGVFSWAVPQFGDGRAPTTGLELVFPATSTRVRTAIVENVATVAKKNLADRIAWLATRSAARGLMKRQLADQMRDNKNGEWLGLAADVFTIATERADLRAWRTLPQSWVAARAFVAPDEPIEMRLAEIGGEVVSLGTYQLQEGETMFVLARALDSGLIAHVVGGEPIDPEPSDSAGDTQPEPNRP